MVKDKFYGTKQVVLPEKWKISGREISLFHLLKAAYIKDVRLV